ncbi:hypothetical protein Q1J52_01995 [Pseudomonas lijiangensis]|uniref:hypothetical protein n=1 Tax=Pseudomonas syringae group TaxID=136849 RepID=UPI001910706E|nr:hypothetical protein [Pseudomonas cichorii]
MLATSRTDAEYLPVSGFFRQQAASHTFRLYLDFMIGMNPWEITRRLGAALSRSKQVPCVAD